MAELGEIILQVENADGSFSCLELNGVPAATRSWICLVSSGGSQGKAYVRELADEIEMVLRGSSPAVEVKPVSCPVEPDEMKPEKYANRRKVLVLVGSSDRKFRDEAWYKSWESDKHAACVMVVLPAIEREQLFEKAILEDAEHLLQRINASLWQEKIAEALPGILSRAEVTSAANRVFISYRRLETLPLALQLFDALTHAGFEVFLDRFSIPPGYDFQRRLNQELMDKSMVVLLESKNLKNSKWTQHEIDFTKRHRLGLVSLRMPDVKDEDAIPSGASAAHPPLGKADFEKPDGEDVKDPDHPGQMMKCWGELTKDALKRVVADIKVAHANALFSRRNRLRGDLLAALAVEGITAPLGAVGPLHVQATSGGRLIWIVTRPPEVDDFQGLYAAQAAQGGSSQGLIVGPRAALEPERLERLEWLQDLTGCFSFDEGNLPDFARRVKSGTWK